MSRPPSVHVAMNKRRASLVKLLPIQFRRLVEVPGEPQGDQYKCTCGALIIVDEHASPRRFAHRLPACAPFQRAASSIGREVRS